MNMMTGTKTFTITEARYITSKIAGDLASFKAHYGRITDARIAEFAEEAAYFLAKKVMDSVEYGLKKNGDVIFSLRYVVAPDGTLGTDDRPGKIPANLDATDAVFYSYLRMNAKYTAMSYAEQAEIDKGSPVQRTGGNEPTMAFGGSWETTKTYSSNGYGVERKTYKQ